MQLPKLGSAIRIHLLVRTGTLKILRWAIDMYPMISYMYIALLAGPSLEMTRPGRTMVNKQRRKR